MYEEINTFVAQGKDSYRKDEYAQAIDYFDQALAINRDDKEAWIYKGLALESLGNHLDAIDCFNKSLIIDKDDTKLLYHKGRILMKESKHSEAMACFRQACDIDTNDKKANWNYAGLAFYDLGQYKNAIACYEKVIRIDTNNAQAWNNKGLALHALGNYAEAMECYEQVLTINKNDEFAWLNKACVFLFQHKLEEAKICLSMPALPGSISILHKTVLQLHCFAREQTCSLFELLDKEFNHSENNLDITDKIEIYLLAGKFFIEYSAFSEAEICLKRALVLKSNDPQLKALEKNLQEAIQKKPLIQNEGSSNIFSNPNNVNPNGFSSGIYPSIFSPFNQNSNSKKRTIEENTETDYKESNKKYKPG